MMADEAEALGLDTPIEGEEQVIEEGAEQQQAEEFTIEIEGEEPDDETPAMRAVRHELRATQRQLWEVTKGKSAEQPIIIGEEPTLESCEWDEDRFKAETRAYDKRVADAEKQKATAAETAEKENHIWQQQLATYQAKAAALPVKDFAQAQDTVTAALSVMMQSVIVKYAKDPAKAVYALGQHPAKLAALAQETDPFKLLIAVREMEDKLVVNKRKPPEPEAGTIQSGSAALSGTTGKTLKSLEDSARKSGDRSALIAFKKSKGL